MAEEKDTSGAVAGVTAEASGSTESAGASNSTETPDASTKSNNSDEDCCKSKKVTSILIHLVIELFAAILGATAVWWYYNKMEPCDPVVVTRSSSGDADEDIDDADVDGDLDAEEVEEEMEGFAGTAVTGEHPEGWSIVEYFDGDGSDMLSEGSTYTGLTGLEVISPDHTVFTLKAIWGIGGIDACENFYEFTDTEPTYYNEIVTLNAESSSPAPTTVTITDADYSAFNVLGVSVRRVDHSLFRDDDTTDAFYNAVCGSISKMVFLFDDLSYTADSYTLNDYQFTVEDTATEEELVILEGILGSLVAI